MSSVPYSSERRGSSFQKILASFLTQPGLPFANVLSAERIEQTFAKHGNLFGGQGIYSTALMVWSFLSQTLRDGKEASCQAAVARVVAHCEQQGEPAPTSDTGDYCRARAKLSEAALRELGKTVADAMELQADSQWLWKGQHHAKLVDGFTVTMQDTPKNQALYPSPRTQKKGVGLPIARITAILSLATACVHDAAMGPYAGKETGETAQLRQLFGSLQAEDVLVADRFYCSFLMIALLWQRQVQVCARMHQRRHVDFRRGRSLGKFDHLIQWTKPVRPEWMDQATYDLLPDTLEMREVRFQVVQPGYRSKTLTIATTLTDARQYTREDIAELYAFRWNAELDIRSIKQALNLCHMRCKSPAMVHCELRTTLLGYNLVRTTAAAAALLHRKKPRQISFTSTCQYILAASTLLSCDLIPPEAVEAYCRRLLAQIASCEVANRPGRIEPRVLKRRRHGYKLMQEPRHILRARLLRENP